jgi:2-polyprenyl-3-methyl-5-hydroxy-6-metoxy-1,4-benzoquinol methylase
LQEKFRKSGQYAATSQEEIRLKIYSDDEKSRNYQVGLLLTNAWWENHFRMAENFYTHAVKNLSVNTVLEIGVGHAFFAYLLLQEKAKVRYLGIDISESAIVYAKKILPASHVRQSIEFRVQDATKQDFFDGNSFDLVICCEVLEHVEDPLSLGKSIRAALSEQGIAFVTTVCNLEAIDHI